MSTPTVQWTPGLPVSPLTLAEHMNVALKFVALPPAATTRGIIPTYSLVQGLVSHYELACGQPDYQAKSGDALDTAHSAFVAGFKPAVAQAFDTRLGGILEAKNPVDEFEREKLSSVRLPDMIDAGLLTFDTAENFSARMAEMSAKRVLSVVATRNFVGSPYSLLPLLSRAFVYIGILAFIVGRASVGADAQNISDSVGLLGGLVFAGEFSSMLLNRLIGRRSTKVSVREALDTHTKLVQAAAEIAAGGPVMRANDR